MYVAPYKDFREDVLLTLGRCLMEPQCWNGRELVIGEMLHRDNFNPNRLWFWWNASGDFSASMFFCLKYLPREWVAVWFRSVLEIDDPHWRAQVIVWSVGAHDMLTGEAKWPAEFNMNARPAVVWDESHCLRADLATQDKSGATPMPAFLPDAAREDAMHVLNTYFSEDVFLEWLDSIARVDYLYSELAEIPASFERLFVDKRKILLV